MKVLYIDRIEDSKFAICEDEEGNEHVLDVLSLPRNAGEGTAIRKNLDGIWILDEQLTKKRRSKILDLIQKIKN